MILRYLPWFLPLISLIYLSFGADVDSDKWSFVVKEMVPGLVGNTLSLLTLSLILGSLLSLFSAYLLEMTNIPGKKFWNVLVLLPLSIPMYILAYIYVGATEWSSPLMTFVRNHLSDNLGNLQNKNVMMVSLVFALGLYPYLYIPIRRKLKRLSGDYYLTALMLKKSHLKVFFSLIMPQLKFVLIIGASLFAMEVLADFGAVSAFNFDTFTTAIYTAWSGLFSYEIACRLSLLLLFFSFAFFYIESRIQIDGTNYQNQNTYAPIRLSKVTKAFGLFFLGNLVFFSFLFPLGQLIYWLYKAISSSKLSWDTLFLMKNTFIIAFGTGIVAVVICLLYIFYERNRRSFSLPLKISQLGYAIPGNIIAIAIFWMVSSAKSTFGIQAGLFILIYGLIYRFMTLPLKHLFLESKKIPSEVELVSRSLKRSTKTFFNKIWLPRMRMGLIYALILMILETAKEMPLTLMLRPLGYDTLSTKIFELTSEGEWERASLHATVLITLGIISTVIIFRGEKNA